ncbi:MAG: hypothetical protein AAF882_21320 [Pseudomonadota bacterium]
MAADIGRIGLVIAKSIFQVMPPMSMTDRSCGGASGVPSWNRSFAPCRLASSGWRPARAHITVGACSAAWP